MISNRHRFHGYRALGLVYRFGSTARGPLFGLRVRKNERRRSYRAAVVVGRKINKSSVVRNRIRRRLYEGLRSLEPKINPGYDIVINVYSDTVRDLPHPQLLGQLKKQLEEAGVINHQK